MDGGLQPKQVGGYSRQEGADRISQVPPEAIGFLRRGVHNNASDYVCRVGAGRRTTVRRGAAKLLRGDHVKCRHAEPKERQENTILFMHNLALMGGLLLLMAMGPGPLSLDFWRRRDR